MTDLLQHAMNVSGLVGGLDPGKIKSGLTVTKVEWHGCMAHRRCVVDIGTVVCQAPSPHGNGRWAGAVVRWDRAGVQWEPFDHFRMVDDELEVWS